MNSFEQPKRNHSFLMIYAITVFASIILSGNFEQAFGQTQQWSTAANGTDIYNTNSGNVGVGTSTPSYRFVVGPNIQPGFSAATMTVSKGPNASTSILIGASSAKLMEFGWDNPNSRAFFNTSPGTPMAFMQGPADIKMFISGSGNVGIGTTTPIIDVNAATSKYLTVDAGTTGFGSVAAGGNTTGISNTVGTLAFFNSNLGVADKRVAIISGRTNGATNSGAIDFWTFNAGSAVSPQLSIMANGNVGIAASNPAYRLDVAGQIRSSSGGFVFPDGSVQTTAAISSSSNASQWSTSSSSISYNTGNVGIGTTTPIIDVNAATSKYLTVDAGTTGFGSVAAGGNTTGISNTVGTLAFFNSNLGVADKRVAIISGRTNGATNSGAIDFWTFNAGSAVSPQLSIMANGNVGVGVSNPKVKLEVAGNVDVTGTITGTNIIAKYQDVAEWVTASHILAAGTVVALDPSKSNQVVASSQAYDSRVAGVVSAQPGIVLGEPGEGKVLVATTGRVRIKVDATRAPIHVGDLLVTSDREGVAMKSEPLDIGGAKIHRPGTLLGKALETLESGVGEILVLLSLQ